VIACKPLPFVLLLSTLTLSACGTCHRAGKDALLGCAAPALALYKGAVDGEASAIEVSELVGGGAGMRAIAFPFTFAARTLQHSVYGLVHLVDLPLCAVYGVAELAPHGPEIMPLDIYPGTRFGEWAAATDLDRTTVVSGQQ
jgi:predicted small secreted protein